MLKFVNNLLNSLLNKFCNFFKLSKIINKSIFNFIKQLINSINDSFKYILTFLSKSYFYNIFHISLIILSFINIITINNALAGGGSSSPPPPQVCTPELIKSCENEDISEYKCRSTPYSPSLPSWDDIRNSTKRIHSFNLDFPMAPSSGYYILDADVFSKYISCSNRYINSGYTPREEKLYGKYCNKWVVGISNDYMNSFIQSGSKANLRPNIDIKVFCSDVQSANSFDNNTSIVGRSYMSASDYYVCRDGVVRKPMVIFGMKIGSCFVATEYKMKLVDYSKCRQVSKCNSYSDCSKEDKEKGNHSCGGGKNKYCDRREKVTECTTRKKYVDDTTYDTGKSDLTGYNISICNSASIIDDIKNVNIVELYDPNLVVNYQ